MRNIFCIAMLICCAFVSTAQNKQIVSGKVIDSTNSSPIIGASVTVLGSTTGVNTAIDGSFTINAAPGAILTITHVAYNIATTAVSDIGDGIIRLSPLVGGLSDVVVVAYGRQKKVSVTGAISSVSTQELVQSSASSLAVALAGRLSGLTSTQQGGGQPGRDDALMYLRGAATLNGMAPLVLIDGVPRDNIRTIDPSEVETVSVLKDASATAVFGVRGANGVILITTRRGTQGKIQLSGNVEQTYTGFTREPSRLHSVQYMRLRNEAALNDSIKTPPFSEDIIAKYENPLAGLDPADPDYEKKAALRRYMYPDHDYYRELIKRFAPQTRVTLNASGGIDKLNYFVSGVYLHQGGNLNTEPKSKLGYDPSVWLDRYNFRANLDYKVAPSLKTFLNIGSYIEQTNMPAAWLYGGDTRWMMTDLFYQAQTILPITPGPVTVDGYGVAPGQVVDPGYMDRSAFEIMNRFANFYEVRSNLNSTFGAEWDLSKLITKGLSLKGMVSYDAAATTRMQGNKKERLYLVNIDYANNTFNYSVKNGDETLLSLSKVNYSRYNINLQGSINYQRQFGRHDVSAMILAQRDNWESASGDLPFNVLGVSGRVTYDYDNRYLAEFNAGYNGSEQFAPKNRYGFFPAASVGWVVSNEKFFEGAKRIVSNLKFRASYGKVGNDKIGSARFLYIDNITMGGGPLGSLGLGQGVNEGLLGNPNIRWEMAEKKNFGIDLGLFNSLHISFDYFKEKRNDILIGRGTLPALQGVPLGNVPKVNLGVVDNKGYEIELSYNKAISDKFSVFAKGNYGFNQNVVTYSDEPIRDSTYAYRYQRTGYGIGQMWGYNIDYSNGNGFFNSKQELDAYLAKTTYGFGTPRVGDFIYKDLNGDNVINDKDMAPIKYTTIPGITYGFSAGFNYSGLDFMIFIQGLGRYSHMYQQQGMWEYTIQGTYFDYHKSAWTPERYAAGEKITYPALSTHSNTNHQPNDFFIFHHSLTRIKNIEIGYTIPTHLIRRVGLKQLRVYLNGQNLYTWDRMPLKHLDPEVLQSIAYPVGKSYSAGLNITF